MVTGSISFRPVARQKHHDGIKAAQHMAESRKQRAEPEEGSRDRIYPSKVHPRDLPPTRSYLLTMPSNYE